MRDYIGFEQPEQVIGFLKSLSALRELDLKGSRGVNDVTVASLSHTSPLLNKLCIADTAITNASVVMIARRLLALEELNLSGNTLDDDAFYESVLPEEKLAINAILAGLSN